MSSLKIKVLKSEKIQNYIQKIYFSGLENEISDAIFHPLDERKGYYNCISKFAQANLQAKQLPIFEIKILTKEEKFPIKILFISGTEQDILEKLKRYEKS